MLSLIPRECEAEGLLKGRAKSGKTWKTSVAFDSSLRVTSVRREKPRDLLWSGKGCLLKQDAQQVFLKGRPERFGKFS